MGRELDQIAPGNEGEWGHFSSVGGCNGSFLRYERVLVVWQLESEGWNWRHGHLLVAQSLQRSHRLTGRAAITIPPREWPSGSI